MKEGIRSQTRIVHSAADLKDWLKRQPSVDEARPRQCPACEAPGRPVGGPLGLWGHGLRARQQRGPLEPKEAPGTVVIAGRRYLCTRCRAIVMVVPRGVVPRRHFSGAAIGLSLALFGLLKLPAREVRRRVNPWRVVGETAQAGWTTLRRWAAAARQGTLFAQARGCPPTLSLREAAGRVAATLASWAPPAWAQAGPAVCGFVGGLHMA